MNSTMRQGHGLRSIGAFLTVGTLAVALAGCGAKNSNSEVPGFDQSTGGKNYAEQFADCIPGENAQDVTDLAKDSTKKITVAAFNGWDESFAAAHLLKYVLAEDGYSVDIKGLDAGPGYTGLARGDVDIIMDSWLPLTHEAYLNQYHDDIEARGCWYSSAKLTIAVNDDSPAHSIGDLKDMGDAYGNRLVGIEPGAGLTKATRDSAIPTYGLEQWKLQTSSTPAMLAELKKATASDTNIAVTLWRPHWAYDAFPIRDLDDPEGAMGEAENILNFSRLGFGESNPYVAQLLQNFVMDDEHLASLENIMFSSEHYGGKNLDAAVLEWAKNNPTFFDDWKSGVLAES